MHKESALDPEMVGNPKDIFESPKEERTKSFLSKVL